MKNEDSSKTLHSGKSLMQRIAMLVVIAAILLLYGLLEQHVFNINNDIVLSVAGLVRLLISDIVYRICIGKNPELAKNNSDFLSKSFKLKQLTLYGISWVSFVLAVLFFCDSSGKSQNIIIALVFTGITVVLIVLRLMDEMKVLGKVRSKAETALIKNGKNEDNERYTKKVYSIIAIQFLFFAVIIIGFFYLRIDPNMYSTRGILLVYAFLILGMDFI